MDDKSPLFQRTITLIKAIPQGKVTSYGQISQMIGAPGCARHVSYILSSSSKKYKLPWHRVIGSGGKVSPHSGSTRQIQRLKKEGVELDGNKIDLEAYNWRPSKKQVATLLKGLPKHTSLSDR